MLERLSVLCCLVGLFCGAACERGCPPPEDIAPCTCPFGDMDTDIRCKNLSETDVLVRVFQNARRYHFDWFIMRESTLQYIPSTIFDDVEVKHMALEDVTFSNTFDRIPKDPGLSVLFLTRVRVMSGWDWKALSAFSKLVGLYMGSIPLKKLSADFRPNVSKKLRMLILSSCQIKKFADDEFVEFADLDHFSVSYDQITTVKRSIFPRQSKLTIMGLEYNKISSLPDDLFVDMPLLKHVGFEGNMLSVLPENTFKPVMRSLRYLQVSMNPIKCDCLFVWLLTTKDLSFKGKCYAPKSLYQRDFSSLSIQEFNC